MRRRERERETRVVAVLFAGLLAAAACGRQQAGGTPQAVPSTASGLPALAATGAAPNPDHGRAIFESQTSFCFNCHRKDLGGLVGPNLTDAYWLHGCSADEIAHTIQTGYPDRGMLPYGSGAALSPADVQDLVAYIRSRRGAVVPNPKPRDPERDRLCE